jgi:hypothetical protein
VSGSHRLNAALAWGTPSQSQDDHGVDRALTQESGRVAEHRLHPGYGALNSTPQVCLLLKMPALAGRTTTRSGCFAASTPRPTLPRS